LFQSHVFMVQNAEGENHREDSSWPIHAPHKRNWASSLHKSSRVMDMIKKSIRSRWRAAGYQWEKQSHAPRLTGGAGRIMMCADERAAGFEWYQYWSTADRPTGTGYSSQYKRQPIVTIMGKWSFEMFHVLYLRLWRSKCWHAKFRPRVCESWSDHLSKAVLFDAVYNLIILGLTSLTTLYIRRSYRSLSRSN